MQLSKAVKRITILNSTDSGQTAPTTIYKKGRGRKKSSPGLKTPEKVTRQVLTAQAVAADTLLGRHKRSRQKRKNGWLRDFPENMARANRKGMKRIKPARWF